LHCSSPVCGRRITPSSAMLVSALPRSPFLFFFFNDTPTTEIYTLSLHDALPIYGLAEIYRHKIKTARLVANPGCYTTCADWRRRSEEHTSELQSLTNLVCRLLLEKKKKKNTSTTADTHS